MRPPDPHVAAAAVGLMSGPWLRGLIVAHSVGYGQPPRRRCPFCCGLLAAVLFDGRCWLCRSALGPSPGSVELIAGTVLAALAYAAPTGWVWVAWAWTALLGVALAFVDVAVLRLPDPLTVAAGAGSLALFAGPAGGLGPALGGGVGLGAVYLAPILSKTMGMGRGDGMLAVVVGVNVGWLGFDALVVATVAAAAIAGVCVAAMLVLGRVRRGDQVPLGSFMLLGALVSILVTPGR